MWKSGIYASRHRGLGFVSLWETTGANETIQLPTPTNYRVDWGDGNITTTETSHEYSTSNQYTIKISGNITDFAFNNSGNKDKLLNISSWGGMDIINGILRGATNVDIIATDIPNVVSTESSFRVTNSLIFNSSIGLWDMSASVDMNSTFSTSVLFNQDLNSWDVSGVLYMVLMFNGASNFNGDISSWDVSNVLDISRMFRMATSFNSDISGWNPISATSFFELFLGATSFDQDISGWDYSNIVNMSSIMSGKSSANYSLANMDALYNKLDNAVGGLIFANMVNVNLSFSTINYTAAGATARASLVSKGFVVTSGSQV